VMYDPRITLQQQVSEQLKAHFGDKVFNTVIPRNGRFAEAPSYGLPGVVLDPGAKASTSMTRNLHCSKSTTFDAGALRAAHCALPH